MAKVVKIEENLLLSENKRIFVALNKPNGTQTGKIMIQEFINKQFYNLFVFTYLFGLVLYGTIKFEGIDEICAMLLFILLIYGIFKSTDWYVNKAFLTVIGIFVFYACYSIYIHSNSKVAILSDFIIQFKPYLAFFAVYYLCPEFTKSQKKILRDVVYVIWAFMIAIGVASFVEPKIFNLTVGHVAYFAAIVTSSAMLFLFSSEGTNKDKVIFLLILATGLLSGRAKFYGFFILATAAIVFSRQVCHLKLNFKTILVGCLCLAAIIAASWQKLVLYFGVGQSLESVPEGYLARAMLYATSFQIFQDYFPLGSGFASFASFSSGVHYSDIYQEYGIELIKGISKNNYSYIADTYYPCLAQFGVVGVILYFFFFFYIFRKSLTLYQRSLSIKHFVIPFLIIGYFLIENIADATFTSHRGFFIMMLLGLTLSESKKYITQKDNSKSNSNSIQQPT